MQFSWILLTQSIIRLKSQGQPGLLLSQGWTGEDLLQAMCSCWLESSAPGLGLHRAAHTWQLVSSRLKAPRESEIKQARSYGLFAI